MRRFLLKVKKFIARLLWAVAHFLLKLAARLTGVEAGDARPVAPVAPIARPGFLKVNLLNLNPTFIRPRLLNLQSLVSRMVRPKLRRVRP